MKHIYATAWCLILIFNANAQWSIDPADPLVVCDAAGNQNSMQAVHDGNGGYYVFWRDGRPSNVKYYLYGQHYDSLGVASWETNGRLIVTDTARGITGFSAIGLA